MNRNSIRNIVGLGCCLSIELDPSRPTDRLQKDPVHSFLD
jgi:hypothetical protein